MKRYLLLTLFSLTIYGIYAQDLHTHGNAASTSNELNAVAGWTGPAEIESKSDNPKSGQYSIRIKSEDNNRHAQYAFTAVPGTTYTITIWARRGQSSNSEFDEWEGFSGFQKRNITGQGWQEYIFSLEAVSSQPVIKVFASKNSSNERTVYIDAVTIYSADSGGSGGGGGGSGSTGSGGSPTVDFQTRDLYSSGNVGIGTLPSTEFRLSVNGIVRTKELIVETGWSDFVFDPEYKLPALTEVEKHIREHGHLKDIPSASEVAKDGIQVGEINKLLLQKIEELTLYMIEADKEIKALKRDKAEMERRIMELESQ